MDFSKLLSKLSVIEGKQALTESEKTDKPWTDMSGKKQSGTAVKGDKYTGKEAEAGEKGRKSYGNSSQYKKYAVPDPIEEGKKPDFLDMDKDGDKDEPMKKAVADKKKASPGEMEDVKESIASVIRRLDAIIEAAEKVEEEDMEEGNEFSGELAKAKAAGKKDFEVDGKKYQVKEASEKKETTWTDKSGKKHPATQVKGDKYTGKEAEKEDKKKVKESQLGECGETMSGGSMMGSGAMSSQDDSGMSINTNINTRDGRKTVSITADGAAADELMQMLKLAGMDGMGSKNTMGDVDGDGDHDMSDHAQEMGGGEIEVELVPLAHQGGFEQGGKEEEEVEEEYSNEPNPQTQGIDAQMHQGTDLHKEKQMVKHNYKGGDNPMAMKEANALAALEAQLMEELESIKVRR
jgi:hypothetical protein